MNYIQWCETVLATLAEAGRDNLNYRDYGIYEEQLEKLIFGDIYTEIQQKFQEDEVEYVLNDALIDMKLCGLVEERFQSSIFKLTRHGKDSVRDLTNYYRGICSLALDETDADLLEILADTTTANGEHYARTFDRSFDDVFEELKQLKPEYSDLSEGDVVQTLQSLKHLRLVICEIGDYIDEVRIGLQGLVWTSMRRQMIALQEIDLLLLNGETTNVELKRELFLRTKEQKAEFVKDLIGLANTRVTGKRCLLVGINDGSLQVHMPESDAWYDSLKLEQMEQIISHYIEPHIDIDYDLVDYQEGKVAVILVSRDPRDLPYKVKNGLSGEKKKVEKGDIYVRHGTLTVKASDFEIEQLSEESSRASGR